MHASKADLHADRLRRVRGPHRRLGLDAVRVRDDAGALPARPVAVPGLPDDRCQCPHWGYLLKGSFRVTYLDGPDEIVRAGEAYHLRPGHFVQSLEPVELIELSPVRAHDVTLAAITRNMAGVTS